MCGSAGVLFLSIRFHFPSSRGRHTFPRRGHAAHDELIGGLGGGVRKERGRPTIKPERNGVMWKVNPYANLAGGTSRNLWTYIYETRSDPLGYIDIQTIDEEGWECYICHRCTITMSRRAVPFLLAGVTGRMISLHRSWITEADLEYFRAAQAFCQAFTYSNPCSTRLPAACES